jgi:hypothetical protein
MEKTIIRTNLNPDESKEMREFLSEWKKEAEVNIEGEPPYRIELYVTNWFTKWLPFWLHRKLFKPKEIFYDVKISGIKESDNDDPLKTEVELKYEVKENDK